MAAVIGLRGMQKDGKFELSTNVKDAGNFDDLVYTANGRRYFLQLKHTENPDTTKLMPKDTGELLHKCFETYCNMDDRNNSEFIIYTNKRLGLKLSGHETEVARVDTVERILKTSNKGEIFNFTRDENKKIDVYSSVENLVRESKDFKGLSVTHQNSKVSMIDEFLNKLIMVTRQKGQSKLDKVIDKEIRKTDEIEVDSKVYDAVLRYFKTELEAWWRNKNEKMTQDMLRNWLQKAKTNSCHQVVTSLFKTCTINLVKTGINFSDSEISRLRLELSNNRAVHFRSDALTLCSILLLDCLPKSHCIFVTFELLQKQKNMLLYAWLGGHWEWLIVSCDSTVTLRDVSDTCSKISEIIKRHPSSKRLIIVTPCSVKKIRDFDRIEHNFSFEQLSQGSQKIVLEKKVDFQGCEVTMKSLLQQHGNVEQVLGPQLVTDLTTQETLVNIGGKLQVNEEYYIPRTLQRNIYLTTGVLKDPDVSHHVFAVSGMKNQDLSEIVPKGKRVVKFMYSYNNGVDYGSSDETDNDEEVTVIRIDSNDLETSFIALCDIYSEKTLHWVEFREGNFLWKRSRGAVESLLNYVDVQKTPLDKRIISEYMNNPNGGIKDVLIWDLNERVVLVVAEPGMGKSSSTTQVAWHTKQHNPTSWVVRINWNDHTKKLDNINKATLNFESLFDFLCNATFPESKYADTDQILLKQSLQNTGNITVFMDGFDEISPTYVEKALLILSTLKGTKVARVWVTSRPVQRNILEKELSVIAFTMEKLSIKTIEDILILLWESKVGGDALRRCRFFAFINDLLRDLNDLLYEDGFTGSPLFVKMIATAYEMDLELSLKSEVWIEPRIDLVNLYEKFFESKLHIHLTEKNKSDPTNPSVQDDSEILKEILLKKFEKCALVAILPPPTLKSLHKKGIEEKIQPFLSDVLAGKNKRGIMMNVVEGKPQFLHRTFAEYFTARWFIKNIESNRTVLEHILFDPLYGFVRDMFDRMLATSSAQHCAMLDQAIKRVEKLWEEGTDVNGLDKGDRSVIHLFAARKRRGRRNDTNIMDFTDSVSHYKVSLDNRDSVLQWTPLQYAIKSADYCTVEWLLKNNADRSGLDMIRQKVHDPGYIDPIVMHAAICGHLLLLEFLWTAGVDIHRARSRSYTSPLHAAAHQDDLEAVRWLIQHGADCNSRNSDGQTLLFHAVRRFSLEVVQVMVEEGGASLDVRDNDGRTAIDWANDYILDLQNGDYGIGWAVSVERRQEIVKYLQDRRRQDSSDVLQNSSG